MKRLFIIVEGQTEESFVKELLIPFFSQHGIYDVRPILIQTSEGHKGGFVNYNHLRNDLLKLLKSQGQDVIVTTFVDFFRCPDVPKQKEIDLLTSHLEKIEAMENSIASDINDWRFIPYIQLHEFEALLFSSVRGFEMYFDENISNEIKAIIDAFDNPEDINSSPETAPSKRLMRIIPGYDKVLFGNIIALENGLSLVLEKCPRFRTWIDTLIHRCKE
ncbi:MAG: DUF4276 family protein [Bacteroides sp.]|nr:DUF4276 family protein [Bacteroides sp.]